MKRVYGDGPWPDLLETSYAEIQKKFRTEPDKHANWASEADSIYRKVKAFSARARDLRIRMKEADPTGDDTSLAEKMLTHTRYGDSIRNELSAVLSLCLGSALSRQTPAGFDLVNGDTRQCTDRRYWNDVAFAGLTSRDAASKVIEFDVACQVQAQEIFENMVQQF